MRLRSKLLVLVPQLVVLGIGAILYAALYNTLERNGAWIPTKTLLHKRVIGASTFYSSRQTLAGQELDLGRWLGFQEVLYHEPMPLEEVSLRFRLAAGAYLDLLYNKNEEGFNGLRIGTGAIEPFAYRADASARFLERVPVQLANPPVDEWQRVRLRLTEGGIVASLNDAPSVPLLGRPLELQRFGYRNGLHSAVIDDVRVRTRDGREFVETFANRSDLLLALGVGLTGLLLVNAAAFAVLRRVRWTPHLTRLAGVLGLMLAGGSVAALVIYEVGLSKSYPSEAPDTERAWREREAENTDASIQACHDPLPAPGVVRILVVGTSQTWGAGAMAPGDDFVACLERMLQAQAPAGVSFECINAGVSGLYASWLLQLYRERWLPMDPDIVVLNLSNNDTSAESLAYCLRGFVETDEKHGIATLFALEANSIEARPGELPLHATMRQVAEEHGVPLVDVHTFLKERADIGLLWWDLVHPTSLGHALIAEALAPEILAAARSRAADENR